MDKNSSYLFGLCGTDGSVKKRNNIITSIVLELIDKDIFDKIVQKVYPDLIIKERTRDTNFKKDCHSYILDITNKPLMEEFREAGFPAENKTDNFSVPFGEYDEFSFWRGVIDGDGSVGMRTEGTRKVPFVSLTTKSENLKISYCDFLEKYIGFKPVSNRNKRDNIYNIVISSDRAVKLMKLLYEDAELYIDRKYNIYLLTKDWVKPPRKQKGKTILWTKQEEEDLLSLTLEDFIVKYPNRTLMAIRSKKRKLLKEVMLNVNE